MIGGYIPGPHGFDSLIVGYYEGKDLLYVARVRNGFIPASRRHVYQKIRHLVTNDALRKPAGHAQIKMGRRTHGGENDAMRLAATRVGCTD